MTETVNLTPNFRAALFEFIAQFAAPVIDKAAIFTAIRTISLCRKTMTT